MIVVDAVSIIWLIAAILWGWVLGQVIVLVALNWWRIRRAVVAWWGNLPPVADLRYRRAREEAQWRWLTATPEERARWRNSTVELQRMTDSLAAVMAQVGFSAAEAAAAISHAFSHGSSRVNTTEPD